MTAVLILSGRRSREMRPVLAEVERCFSASDVRFAADAETAVKLVERDGWFPDLAVACQHRPGEFSHSSVRRLLTLLPLTRWICVRGAWCESDGRNGSPWPASVCVRARAAGSRIRRERAVLDGTATALALTASLDEAYAFDHQPPTAAPPVHPENAQRRVSVHSCDRSLLRAMCDVLRASGWEPASAAADAIVWDADPLTPERCEELQRLRVDNPGAIVVAVMTLPYPADIERLKDSGAAAVVAKANLTEMLAASLVDPA